METVGVAGVVAQTVQARWCTKKAVLCAANAATIVVGKVARGSLHPRATSGWRRLEVTPQHFQPPLEPSPQPKNK